MTPSELKSTLERFITANLRHSIMIWGAPGIGKSSIVAQVAKAHHLEFTDLRLSQLAPTDLRGLPVPENGVSRWFPPVFLPRSGSGILFLDELNLAPPALQGVAQQLILDRKVGEYIVPEGWFIWAAGNRKEDRASVFDMPAPLANRFVHFEVEPDFDAFKAFALERGLHEQILGFLSFRPTLLHRMDDDRPAWASPRSWEIASSLHRAGLDIGSAVGSPAAAEFYAFLEVYALLPSLEPILAGTSTASFPSEPSAQFAITTALATRAKTAKEAVAAFRWVARGAPRDWLALMANDLRLTMQSRGQVGAFAQMLMQDKELREAAQAFQVLLNL
jgi:hypothetical protein